MAHPLSAGFSRKLRCLRNHFGVAQADLANHLGISQPVYHKMECKAAPPRLERLRQIAEFYGVSFVELLEHPVEELVHRVQGAGRVAPPPALAAPEGMFLRPGC